MDLSSEADEQSAIDDLQNVEWMGRAIPFKAEPAADPRTHSVWLPVSRSPAADSCGRGCLACLSQLPALSVEEAEVGS